jgi:hypothetical protein
MLAEISANAVQLHETIGRSAFDERVMAAMEKVLRHEVVPIDPLIALNRLLALAFALQAAQ